jgi:hypothetical protein
MSRANFSTSSLACLIAEALEIGISGAPTATGAFDNVVGLRIFGYRELIAAARLAAKC